MRFRSGVLAALALFVAISAGSPVAFGQGAGETSCPEQVDHEAIMRAYFGPLMARLGETVGRPTGCIGDASDGGVSLPTTTGLLYARPESGGPVRIVVFTDGHRHWAMDASLSQITLYWEGTSAYPPAAGVSRLPATRPGEPAPAPWPVAPVPTVGRSAPTPVPAHRPENGENLTPSTFGGGRSSLIVTNDIPQDVALKLRDTDGARATRAFVYVRTGEQFRLEGVQPGSYLIQVAIGSSWDSDAKIFSRGLVVFQIEEAIEFEEKVSETGVEWWDRTLRLYRTGEFNDGMTVIDPATFQQD